MTTWFLAALVLSACLTGNHPFYSARDAVADDRIVGEYVDEQTSTATRIARTTVRGRYRVTLEENGARSLYSAVLFKLGTAVFLDLSAEAVPRVKAPAGTSTPATDILTQLTANRKHVAVRVRIGPTDLSVWAPNPVSMRSFLGAHPELKRTVENEVLVILTQPTETLRDLLARYGQDRTLFVDEYVLIKRPSEHRTLNIERPTSK
jgi:hypothetical protein